MIKQIQLRGISRSPSDRMSQDGGLDESLNLYIDSAENAPALMPEDVTASLGLPDDLQADRIFVHKTANYENIILYDAISGALSAHVKNNIEPFFNVGEVSSISLASVGNTLLVSTEKEVNYFLFKNDTYKSLGTRVPFPTIKFTAKHADEVELYERRQTTFSIEGDTSIGSTDNYWLTQGEYTQQVWNELNALTEKDPDENPGTTKVNQVCNEMVLAVYASAKENKVFVDHVFVRYAVTLWDDSVISSIPFLMAGGYEDPLFIRYTKESLNWYKTLGESAVTETYKNENIETLICKARYPYRIQAKLLDDPQIFEDWKDLIKSIDIYVSEKGEPRFDEIFATICQQQGTDEYAPYYSKEKGDPIISQGMTFYEWLEETKTYLFLSLGGPIYQSEFINRLLDKSQFYRLESIGYASKGESGYASFVRRMEELREGSEVKTDEYFEDYDALVARNEMLRDDDMLHSEILWSQAVTLNNSLVVSGVYENIGTGTTLMMGAALDIEAMAALSKDATLEKMFSNINPTLLPPEHYAYTSPMTYTFIVEEDGLEYVVEGRNEKGETLFVDTDYSYFGWVVFPHRNCKRVILGTDYGYSLSLSMKPHPWLDCSYAYIGLDRNIAQEVSDYGDELDVPTENRRISKANKIYVTTIDNPFVFPLEGRYTFQSRVLGVAIATTALSQGQFGQFPLYVFTEDGVWAMETAADGSFVTSKPLSRDVCINPDSITSIDNAVIFVTAKGVMLLQGSQVVNISPFMNGRHYAINESSRERIGRTEFADLIPVLEDSTPFMGFMKEASVAYDYQGKRLVFIKKDEDYQYVYKLDTQTWHKTAYGTDLLAPINSYPECYVQGKRRGTTMKVLYASVYIQYDGTYVTDVTNSLKRILPDLTEAEVEAYLDGDGYIDVTGLGDDDYEFVYVELDEVWQTGPQLQEITLESSTRIYDLSTVLDGTREQKTARGCIITRPMDFGYADVRKVIKDIRIRGQYAKGAVSFMLLGSDDGETYHVLNSLRGRSWKLFRIIILADLDRHERISWIDIDFETRFTNRLR